MAYTSVCEGGMEWGGRGEMGRGKEGNKKVALGKKDTGKSVSW